MQSSKQKVSHEFPDFRFKVNVCKVSIFSTALTSMLQKIKH